MSKFKVNEFKISSENQSFEKFQISELNSEKAMVIKSFELQPLVQNGGKNYNQVKSKYGPISPTDGERANRGQKDRRFSLNPLIRDHLSVEQEEMRVIEEKVRDKVDELSDQIKIEAFSTGYNDGLQKGYEEAFKKAQLDANENLQKLEALIEQFENAKTEIFQANERFLMEVMYRIAKMVLLKDLSMDSDYLLRLAKELVSRIGIRENVIIRIHPQDVDSIKTLKEGLINAFGEMRNLKVEVSTLVQEGGCQVETEWSAIDASIETQLQSLYEALIGKTGLKS
jgi:flagellar assembly protein FliH